MTEEVWPQVRRTLMGFQRATVRHVAKQFYGQRAASRFLVADETGLGKSLVARGVIARAVDHLNHDPDVDRIDVVYVCSNTDLARQNIRRLRIPGSDAMPFASRLTLLGAQSAKLAGNGQEGKPVNIISFTPGTSFEMGMSTGTAAERAMLYLALRNWSDFSGDRDEAVRRLFQVGVAKLESFDRVIAELESEIGPAGIDQAVLSAFYRGTRDRGLVGALHQLVSDTLYTTELTGEQWYRRRELVGQLRHVLAEAGVETLQPDLIILDEFQRFRQLLDQRSAAGELAHFLFNYRKAKVLLLSATPYKPFTYAEEREESHERDFMETLEFLANGAEDVSAEDIRGRLRAYRAAVIAGKGAAPLANRLRRDLLKVMSRAERPAVGDGAHRETVLTSADEVGAADLAGYVALKHVSSAVGQPKDRDLISPEYWKSAPYFANFCDGYQLGRRLAEASPAPAGELARTQHISRAGLEAFQKLDPGNARMRALVASTLDKGWWKLLWVPPSLPYIQPEGPYASPEVTGMTKRLVFSSWAATPPSVASILSYEAERRAAEGTNYESYTPEGRKRIARSLQYQLREGRPARMSTMLLFWPFARIAEIADPLNLVKERGGTPLPEEDAFRTVRAVLARRLGEREWLDEGEADGESGMRSGPWRTAFSSPETWSSGITDAQVISAIAGTGEMDDEEHQRDSAGLQAHLALARELQHTRRSRPDRRTLNVLADIALNSPGNVAYRALGRLIPWKLVGSADHVVAAMVLANGLRSLFNRPHVIKLLEQVTDEAPYWRRVLQYSAWGNLQAVMDEYLHHLRSDQFGGELDAEAIRDLAWTAAQAINLRTTTYRALDVDQPQETIPFTAHFALRYGGRRQKAEDARQPEVRRSFNSPFWPFVLASTSVGQEGIDFHWWCHSVFHWNTPPNPVDFEQREGRVDRYRGHAIRKNVAQHHGAAVLQDPGRDPWSTAWKLAQDLRSEYGDFTPSWVYPGDAKIERHVVPFVMSSDMARYERVKRDVALYRLTFGQPRQEDMLELLREQGTEGVGAREDIQIRLTPR